MGAERIHEFLHRDHRAVRRHRGGRDHVAPVGAHRGGDLIQPGRQLLLGDGEAFVADAPELLAQGGLALDRVGGVLGQLQLGDPLALILVGEVGEQQLSRRRRVQRQARAGREAEVDQPLAAAAAAQPVDQQQLSPSTTPTETVKPVRPRSSSRYGWACS